MGFFDSIFNPGKAYDKSQEQLDKYYNQSQGYQQPFYNQGTAAGNDLSQAMKNLLNPGGLQDQWTKGYQESDAAKFAEQEAQSRGLDAASSLGLNGSSTALSGIQRGTAGIMANDKQAYLDQLMQKYLAGTGIAGNIYNTGENAASQMGQNAMNMGQNSAQMAYNRQNAPADLVGKIGGAALGAGATVLGGPIGGALASRWNLSGGK